MANAWASLFGPGGKAIVDSLGHNPTVDTHFTEGPLFEQGKTATNDWLNQLTSDQQDPSGNFGAISPDWNDIWQQTQQHVHDYYNGTATNPGVNDQIKASFAQRGMSGDPAASFLQSQSGANEAQQIGNASAQQNIAQQQFAQQGKSNWLNSIAQFQNQTTNGPAGGQWNTTVTPTMAEKLMGVVGPVASAAASAYTGGAAGAANNNWLSSILGSSGGGNPSGYAPGIQSGSPNWAAGTWN